MPHKKARLTRQQHVALMAHPVGKDLFLAQPYLACPRRAECTRKHHALTKGAAKDLFPRTMKPPTPCRAVQVSRLSSKKESFPFCRFSGGRSASLRPREACPGGEREGKKNSVFLKEVPPPKELRGRKCHSAWLLFGDERYLSDICSFSSGCRAVDFPPRSPCRWFLESRAGESSA